MVFVTGWDGGEGEKAPFLRNEPVKLTPAWEGSNLPNDTLNLKGNLLNIILCIIELCDIIVA